jgi:ABC-type antimicrobial peptide transport system permease subunit
MGFSVLGFSLPVFVIGYALIYLFSIELGWLPVQGYQRIADGFGGWLIRLILPSMALAVVFVAFIARMTRTSVLEVLGEDYIRTARAKGQTETKVLLRHALLICRQCCLANPLRLLIFQHAILVMLLTNGLQSLHQRIDVHFLVTDLVSGQTHERNRHYIDLRGCGRPAYI